MKVLIAYATHHGSTTEVANFIGDVLQEHFIEATVADVTTIQSVQGYDAYIVGSPVYGGMWLTEMSHFIERFADEMKGKPFYYWMTCIRVLESDGYEHAIENYVHKPTMEKLGVRDIGVFAGKINWNDIDLKERWTLAARYDGDVLPGSRNDDFRDWNAIRQWTKKVRDELAG